MMMLSDRGSVHLIINSKASYLNHYDIMKLPSSCINIKQRTKTIISNFEWLAGTNIWQNNDEKLDMVIANFSLQKHGRQSG